jgi:hypothetical protein
MINRERFGIFLVLAAFYRNANSIGPAGPACLLAILLASLCLPAMALAQTQLGGDIVAEMSQIESNASVSLSSDGNRLAVGARDNDGNGFRAGHVRVHEWSGTAWIQIGADIDGDGPEDMSGQPVLLSSDGNRVAISAVSDNGNGENSGRVRVYQWSGTVWTQLGADIDGEAADDRSGSAISLSYDGSRLAIGAEDNDGNGDRSGHVRVYQWSGTSWQQLGADIDGEAARDRSGRSISLSYDGNRLAIGAAQNSTNGSASGHVRVYQWSGTVWEQLGANINGEAASDYSGYSVSLSSDGDRLAIGAPYNDGHGPDSGHVRVYQWSGTVWEQLGADIDGETEGDNSGFSISLSSDGNRLAIGAASNDDNGTDTGQVRIYQWTGLAWRQPGSDIDSYSQYDYFGRNVSLSSDGNRVASATGNRNAVAERLNRVRVYDLSMFSTFRINAGLNDAWYDIETDGQGFFITVFPDLGAVSLAWFTYDTELPPVDATANLGDPGHRWLTAVGPIDGNQVKMDIEMTSGGIFDTSTEITRTDPPGSDGTLLLTFDSCSSGTIEYDIPSINRQGTVPIQRVANDNIVLCEALKGD